MAPLRRPIILKDARISVLTTFPYLVFYRVKIEQVRVLAVLHAHRDPETWQEFL
jgi:plasmid stabilization system protein ParE